MPSYEYIQFVNEKALEYLPRNRVSVGDKIKFRCPFCGDSQKSAQKMRGFYYLRNASFYCFNCGMSMSGIRLLEALSGQAYDEIKREYLRLYAKTGFSTKLSADQTPDEPGIFQMKAVVRPEWKKPLSEDARAYLAGRMVDRAPFLKDGLYSCECKRGEYILIPWTINGVEAYYQLNDFKRLGETKYVFPKDRKKTVYGLDNVDPSWPYVIVFEGVYDSLFVKNAVAVGTKSVTKYQLDLIKERWPKHQIAISFDNDAPGLRSMQKIVEGGSFSLFFKWFGDGGPEKDVNERVVALRDPLAFSDRKALEKMMMTPLQMKMWLVENGHWTDKKQAAPAPRGAAPLDFKSALRLFE